MATAREFSVGGRVGAGVLRGFLTLAALAVGSFFFGFFLIAPMLPGNQAEQVASSEPPPPASDNGSALPPSTVSKRARPAVTPIRPADTRPTNVNPTIEAPTSEKHGDTPVSVSGTDDASAANPFANVRAGHKGASHAATSNNATTDDADDVTHDQPADASQGAYRVQLGVFSRRVVAESKMQDARDRGFDATVQEFTSKDGRTQYRVQCGPFDDANEAKSTKHKLNDAGFDAFVPRR